MDEEPVVASDKLDEIQNVIDYLKREDRHEKLSLGELVTIDKLYEIVKEHV